MTRIFAATAALLLLATGARAESEAPAPGPAGPASFTVKNECKTPVSVDVGGVTVKAGAGETSAPGAVDGPAEERVFPVKLTAGAKAKEIARLSMLPNQKYALRVADCRAGSGDLHADWLTAPKPASPHAAAKVRFRSRAKRYVEYKSGKKGPFKPLSLAFTRLKEIPAGDFEFTARLRAKRRGPVMGMLKRGLKLKAGHRYLVEVDVVGRELLFTVEDEGLVK